MKSLRRTMTLMVTALALLVLPACSTTSVTGSWKSTELTRPVGSMLVIVRVDQESLRRMGEDRFATALQDLGVNAVASYRVFPATAELEKEAVEAKTRELGLEGILIARILEKEERERRMVADPYPYYPVGDPYFARHPYYRHWYPYYGYGYGYPYAETLPVQYTVLRLETNLYRPDALGLIWSAWTETTVANGLEKKLDEVARKVVDRMVAEGAI